MIGEEDQYRLQRYMAPLLQPETYVYCTFPDHRLPDGLDPMCTFRESEGLTAIVERSQALRADITHVFESRFIKLTVHSSLNAVGFLALVSNYYLQVWFMWSRKNANGGTTYCGGHDRMICKVIKVRKLDDQLNWRVTYVGQW